MLEIFKITMATAKRRPAVPKHERSAIALLTERERQRMIETTAKKVADDEEWTAEILKHGRKGFNYSDERYVKQAKRCAEKLSDQSSTLKVTNCLLKQ